MRSSIVRSLKLISLRSVTVASAALILGGDYFRENVPTSPMGTAAPLFWPGAWVGSGTGTVDVRPMDNISVRLEYRHDASPVDMFFKGAVAGDGGAARPFAPNAKAQDTMTLGVTTWL